MITCPRGTICLSHVNFFGGAIIILLGLYLVNRDTYKKLHDQITDMKNDIDETREEVVEDKLENQIANKIDNAIQQKIGQQQPQQGLMPQPPIPPPPLKQEPPAIKRMPINIETRPDGGDYQQVGILTKESIADEDAVPGNNTDSVILPLFGRPTYRGSQMYNYYTSTDKYHQVRVPLTINGDNCTDQRGCKEIYDNDTIQVPGYNGNFKVQIYKLDYPRYIPYVN